MLYSVSHYNVIQDGKHAWLISWKNIKIILFLKKNQMHTDISECLSKISCFHTFLFVYSNIYLCSFLSASVLESCHTSLISMTTSMHSSTIKVHLSRWQAQIKEKINTDASPGETSLLLWEVQQKAEWLHAKSWKDNNQNNNFSRSIPFVLYRIFWNTFIFFS